MRKGLDGRECFADILGVATARTPARPEHLHSRDQFIRKRLDSIEGLAAIRGDVTARTPA